VGSVEPAVGAHHHLRLERRIVDLMQRPFTDDGVDGARPAAGYRKIGQQGRCAPSAARCCPASPGQPACGSPVAPFRFGGAGSTPGRWCQKTLFLTLPLPPQVMHTFLLPQSGQGSPILGKGPSFPTPPHRAHLPLPLQVGHVTTAMDHFR
jgi:hypothetical protein